jgi:hypothetical protein
MRHFASAAFWQAYERLPAKKISTSKVEALSHIFLGDDNVECA